MREVVVTPIAFAELGLRFVLGSFAGAPTNSEPNQTPPAVPPSESPPAAVSSPAADVPLDETPTPETPTAPAEIGALVEDAQTRGEAGDFAGAANAWQTALERLPEEPMWRRQRANFALTAGEQWVSAALEGKPRESLTRAAAMLDAYLEQVHAAYGSTHDDTPEMEAIRTLRSDIQARLALLDAEQRERPTTTAPAARPPSDSPTPRPTEKPLFSPAAWSLTGVAIAGFGIGITFGALALARKKSADCGVGEKGTLCTSAGARDARDSRRFAVVSDVSIAVGAVSAVAVIAIVATRANRRQRARAAAWSPMIGPRAAGLAWSGRF